MALKGIKVLEFVGLAPGPFCGKILSDFGARVTRLDRVLDNSLDVMQNGKQTIVVNLKHSKGQSLIHKLAKTHDVIIDPFRPGVMEKLQIGPEELCKINPRLIYARLTGFGQNGRLSQRAGHDINYAALSGVLSMLGKRSENPTPPINILADFAGGGLMCAFGILLALLERHHSGLGQIIDASMVDGAAYVASWLFMSRSLPIWYGEKRGSNTLDGGAYFYDVYETRDGKFMSVGALEPQFFELFKEHLGLSDLSQFHLEEAEKVRAKDAVKAAFLKKTQDEWSKIFEDIDACVYPVVDWENVYEHAHNMERKTFKIVDNIPVPNPAPRLSRTPGSIQSNDNWKMSKVFEELRLSDTEIQDLCNEGVLQFDSNRMSKL